MVGHVKDGYEGYNSTPSSPTKYTVNGNHGNRINGYVVSKQCMVIAAITIVIALLAIFLATYFTVSSKCEKYEPHQQVTITNGQSKNNLEPYDSNTIPYNDVKNKTKNLAHDQIEINIEDDENYGSITTTGEYQTEDSDDMDEVEPVPKKNNYRLSRNLIPLHYEIRIIPFFHNLSTYGEVNITIQCTNQTDQVVMNLKDIKIKNNIKVSLPGSQEPVLVEDFTHDEEKELMVIHLRQQLAAEQVFYVYIEYFGNIRKTSNGLYVSYFDNKGTPNSFMVSTLFSPTHARSVYPSFDEPSFKSSFTFSIGRQKNMFSLSNTEIISTEPIYELFGWEWDNYQKTPSMSTYLTAFLVAPVESLKRNTFENSTNPVITLWTRPISSYQSEIGQKLADNLINFYEQYFNIKFPLSKIDIVAVPSLDFGAMENWGLITFREEKILADKSNSITSQQSLAFMLAHEIAHQWFGNLVTPEWWDDVWLKEGFSSYFQYLSINELFPSWEVFNEFSLMEMEKAFLSDSMTTSHPITKEIYKADKKIFNGIPYHKGSSIIQMMAHFLGQEKLKSGLTSYLNKFAYGNAKQQDLWDYLSKDGYAYDEDKIVQLNTIMDTWTQQAGYPVITVTRNYYMKTAEIKQERFLLNGKKDNISSLWWIPISYTSRIEKKFYKTYPKYWMPAEEKISISKLPNNESWILLNLQSTGFYRVNYDDDNWILLINDFRNLAPGIKSQLIKDSFNLARGGKLKYEIPLSMAAQLSSETDYLPWQAVSQVFDFLKSSIIKMPAYEYFQLYVGALVRTVYSSLVREINISERSPWIVPDNPIAQRHAENVINVACSFQEIHCVSTAKVLYQNWMSSPDDGNIIPVSIRSIVYCTAIREGGHKEWEFAFRNLMRIDFTNAEDNYEKTNLLKALGCSAKPWLSTRALGFLTVNSALNKKDGMILFKSVASNNIGHWIAHSFIQSEWERMLDFYESPNAVYEMVCSVVDYINSPYEITQLSQLVNKIVNKTQEKSEILSECLEKAENNKFWMEKNYLAVSRWLETFAHSYELN